jgi:hypothetical protein
MEPVSIVIWGFFIFLGLVVLAIPIVIIVAVVGGWRAGRAAGDALLHQQNQYKKSQGR